MNQDSTLLLFVVELLVCQCDHEGVIPCAVVSIYTVLGSKVKNKKT